jgi:subfamily B ATP-binding cassette protein MsbA
MLIKSDLLSVLRQTFQGEEPASRLIRQTAYREWRLIVINLFSSVVQSLSEGATLGIVFLAAELLSAPEGSQFNWSNKPLIGWFPATASWLSGLSTTSLFLSLLALAVVLQAFQSLTGYVNQVSMGFFSARCKALVTTRIHSQVLGFSFPCASGYKVGDLTDYATVGPEAIRIQIEQISGLLIGLLLCLTYLVVLVRISYWLLLAVLIMAVLITLVQKLLLPRIRAGSKAVTQSQVEINSRITEDFQGLRLLHSTGQLDAADDRLVDATRDLERHLRGQARRMAVVGPFISFLPILAITTIAGLSLLFLGGRGNGVLPRLVTFVLALMKLNGRVSILTSNFNYLAENTGRLQRLNYILSPEGKEFRRLGGKPFRRLRESICFESVGLRYSPELHPALKDISFTLSKGKKLALVGSSGAGKSSIADLLTGLYEPTEGRILIDGIPLDQLQMEDWQQRLGVVSQDTFLFNATIAENISFGTPRATRSMIESACEAAQAASFIENLPMAYDTVVGERGYRLSGGQRQRLSLARAILRDPELLILDEATSALDSQSERLVQEALEQFERNHTVLVIAHRLSTIVQANQIIVMESGRIVEYGTHESLMSEAGKYTKLWMHQEPSTQIAVS